jgi:hypothetical protein
VYRRVGGDMENKTRAVASLLGTLSLTDEGKKLSNMMYIEDQGCATAIFRDGAFYRIPTSGDALDTIYYIVKGLREKRDADRRAEHEEDGNQFEDSMPTC